jgi:hypothetical protein
MEASGNLKLAASWLAHPVSVLALVVLIINDHVLKQSYGTWWTGKLSDAAGMVFFPALVALTIALLRPHLPWRTLVFSAVGVTAIGFAWVKATSAGAAAASGILSAIGGPSLVRHDPTDLLALPFLAFATLVAFRPASRATWKIAIVLPVAVIATAATSQDPSINGVSSVQTVDEQVYVAEADLTAAQPRPHDWWATDGGAEFRELEWQDDLAPAVGTAQQCLTWDPSVCYRAYSGNLGVQVSRDSGATWSVDWLVPEVQRDWLVSTYGLIDDSGDRMPSLVETREVAVLGDESGYYVYAANGVDGVAMRSPDGTWERIGSPGYETWREAKELPPIYATEEFQDGYVRWLVGAFALLVGAMTVSGVFVFRAGARKASQPWWIVAAAISLVPFGAMGLLALEVSTMLSEPEATDLGSVMAVVASTLLCTALFAVAMLVASPLKALAGVGAIAAVAVVSAFAAGAIPATFGTQLLVGAAIASALAGLAALLFLRWLANGSAPTNPRTAWAENPAHQVH